MKHLAKHECEETGMFVSIYADDDGYWILETDDDRTGIKFCPFCGFHLPPIAEELIQARKAELEEIERNRPSREPIAPEMVAQMMNDYKKIIKDELEQESPFLKLLSKKN